MHPKRVGGKVRLPLPLAVATVGIAAILLLAQLLSTIAYAAFLTSTAITINGTWTDWGTTSSPTTGAYPTQDVTNTGTSDGTGFNDKSSDILYV